MNTNTKENYMFTLWIPPVHRARWGWWPYSAPVRHVGNHSVMLLPCIFCKPRALVARIAQRQYRPSKKKTRMSDFSLLFIGVNPEYRYPKFAIIALKGMFVGLLRKKESWLELSCGESEKGSRFIDARDHSQG